MASSLQPNSNGLHPNSDGLQPKSDGLQPKLLQESTSIQVRGLGAAVK